MTKRCHKCGEEKPLAAFALRRASKDGLQLRCRDCSSVLDRARYAADPEGQRQRVRDYRAADPEAERARHRALYAANLERSRAYERQWYREHLEQSRKYGRDHYHRHAERINRQVRAARLLNPEVVRASDRAERLRHIDQWRAHEVVKAARRRGRLRANGSVQPISVERIIARDGLRCHICGGAVPRSAVSLDHLVPIALGGRHEEANLGVAHRSCNFRRGAGRSPAQLHLL